MENLPVKAQTYARTICLAIALINQVLVTCGYYPMPLEDETVYSVISVVVTVATALWSWWKNNSFTQKAIKADQYKDAL